MDINDFAKLVLVLSLSFSLVGIAVQIMRLLGTTNETLKLSHDILKNMTKLGEKFTAVSYTHLDVYKRQIFHNAFNDISR